MAQIGAFAQWTSFPGGAQEIVCGSSSQLAVIGGTSIYKRNFSTSAWVTMTGSGQFDNLGLGADGMLYGKSTTLLNSTSNLIKFNAIPAVANAYTAITGVLYNNISVQSQYYAIGCTGSGNNNVYYNQGSGWQVLPGSTAFAARKVVVGYDGTIYAMNWSAGNNVYAYSGGTWTAVSNGTITATDIAVGDAGKVMAIAANKLYYRQNGSWVLDATAPASLSRVSVATDGTIFLLTTSSTNNIYTNTWQNVVCGGGISSPVNTTPSQNLSICAGQATTLTVTGNGIINYNGPSGGSGTVIATPVLNANATYTVTRAENGCISAPTIITITVAATPTVPVSNTSSVNLSICSGNTTTLSVSGSGTFEWYDASSGGILQGSGNTLIANTLTTNTTYYVQNGTGNCASSRTPITVTVSSSVPPAPTSIMSSLSLSVCSSSYVSLKVNEPNNISWYTLPTGGLAVATGSVYNINQFPPTSVESYYTYYAGTSNTCGASLRTAITVTVKAGPSEFPVITNPSSGTVTACAGEQFTLSATHPSLPITWTWPLGTIGTGSTVTYSFASPGTPRIDANVTENGCTIWKTTSTLISPKPTTPIVTTNSVNLSICPTNTTVLTATGTPSLSWFSSSTSTIAIGTGTLFTTPTLTTTTPYYVAAYQGGCYSNRAVQTVTVKAGPTVAPVLQSPTTNSMTVCSGQSFTLSASHPSLPITWDSPLGTIGTGTTITHTINTQGTPVIYANVSNDGCLLFTSIQLTVNATPSAPSITSSTAALSVCSNTSATLTATGSPVINWFNDAVGGLSLTTGTVFTTPTLTNNITYYISSIANGCESPRAAKTVTVKALPAPPTDRTVNNGSTLTLCSGQSTSIWANTSCLWYTVPSGGSALGQGFAYSTPTLTSNTSYYAESSLNGCTSALRAAIEVTVTLMPSIASQTVQNATCNGVSDGSIELTLNNATSYTYTWMPNVSNTYSATALQANVYTVQIANGQCVKTQTYSVTQPASYSTTVAYSNGTLYCPSYLGSPSFQWVDCNNNNSPIPGEIYSAFTPTATGSYALVFGYGSCVNTLTCNSVTVQTTALNENVLLNAISLQPNPASTFFTLNNVANGTTLNVMDVTGKVVVSNSFIDEEKTMTIETQDLANGIYIIQLENNGAVAHKKLIISK